MQSLMSGPSRFWLAVVFGLVAGVMLGPAHADCPHRGNFDHPHCRGGMGGNDNVPPIANPGGPYVGTVGEPVAFDGTGSSDPDGPDKKLRYEWDLGDGNLATGATPSHVYAAAGEFTVRLAVTDNKGARTEASTTATISSAQPSVGVELVATGLSSPLYLTSPPGDGSRLFVVERAGVVRIVQNGALLPDPFLDIGAEVSGGSNQGLFSLAFHPDYAANGRFFLYFTNLAGEPELREYLVSADPDQADAASGFSILTIPQPPGDHFGGVVAFDLDGLLYVAVGDGGSGSLTVDTAQDLSTLLGKMVRVDVDSAVPYAIPPDNPFLDTPEARPEIWALGLRNPWRFSFDRVGGDVYIADVGQQQREEVNVTPSASGGHNYGWKIMEGTLCFDPPTGCDPGGLTLPTFEYDHTQGCSITGGHVYRGQAMPAFVGVYFYSDFCQGWLRSFRVVDGSDTDHREWEIGDIGNVYSFGEDADGELYMLSTTGVYRLVEAD